MGAEGPVARLETAEAEVERLRERIVGFWHDDVLPGELHEALGMTWEEYGKWACPPALAPDREERMPWTEEDLTSEEDARRATHSAEQDRELRELARRVFHQPDPRSND